MKPQVGYVVESENYSSVALIYYEKKDGKIVEHNLGKFPRIEIDLLDSEEELRKYFDSHVNIDLCFDPDKIYFNLEDDIYFREEVHDLVPKN